MELKLQAENEFSTSWPSWTSLIVDFGKDVHHLCLNAPGREWHRDVWSYAGNGNVDASSPFGEINNLNIQFTKLIHVQIVWPVPEMDTFRFGLSETLLQPNYIQLRVQLELFKDLCACIMSIKTWTPGSSGQPCLMEHHHTKFGLYWFLNENGLKSYGTQNKGALVCFK